LNPDADVIGVELLSRGLVLPIILAPIAPAACRLAVFAPDSRASAMITLPSGPRPLFESLRTEKWVFCERKGTRDGAHRGPNALSDRSISTRLVLCMRASVKAPIAVGISSMRRPVKISAKFAI